MTVFFFFFWLRKGIGNDAKGEKKATGLRVKKRVLRRKEESGEGSGGEEMSAFAR